MESRGSLSFQSGARLVQQTQRMVTFEVRMRSSLQTAGRVVALRRGQPIQEILDLLNARDPCFRHARAMLQHGVAVKSTAELDDNADVWVVLDDDHDQRLDQSTPQADTMPNPLAEAQPHSVPQEAPAPEPELEVAPAPAPAPKQTPAVGTDEKENEEELRRQPQATTEPDQHYRPKPDQPVGPLDTKPAEHNGRFGPVQLRGLNTAVHTSHAPVSSGNRQETYLIAIYTANESTEGDGEAHEVSPHTDATVRIELHGVNGKDSGQHVLRPADQHAESSLLPGSRDQFCITCADLGDLDHITIGHDNDGKDARTSCWKVDKVVVTCSKQWEFVLHDDEDGGKWIGAVAGGSLATYDEDIQRLREQIKDLEKKLQEKQKQRAAAVANPGATSPQMRRISATTRKKKNNHKREAACCYIAFFSLLGAFLGDFVAQEHELTAGVTFDVVDKAEVGTNRTALVDETVTSTVKIGWLFGLGIGLLFAVALWKTWSWIWRHKWKIMFCLSMAGQCLIFILGFWRWIPDCIADEGPAQIDFLNYSYEPLDRERGFLLVLFSGCIGMAALATRFGPLSLGLGTGSSKTKKGSMTDNASVGVPTIKHERDPVHI